MTFEHYEHRAPALAAEWQAIEAEAPRYNQRVTNRRTANTETVGGRIRKVRESAGLSQSAFGAWMEQTDDAGRSRYLTWLRRRKSERAA